MASLLQQYLDDPTTREQVQTLIDEIIVQINASDLPAAWNDMEDAAQLNSPHNGFSVAADGPGYVARCGDYEAWSVDDGELVGNDKDTPATPAKALRKLANVIRSHALDRRSAG